MVKNLYLTPPAQPRQPHEVRTAVIWCLCFMIPLVLTTFVDGGHRGWQKVIERYHEHGAYEAFRYAAYLADYGFFGLVGFVTGWW